MNQVFFIPGPLPRFNEIIGRSSHWTYNSTKKSWTRAIAFAIRKAKLKPMGRVYIHWLWLEKDMRMDPDNIAAIGKKFCLDALVKCGVLKNDGWKHIAGWSDDWTVDQKRPGVLVTLEER